MHERLYSAAKSRVTKCVENATPPSRGRPGEDAIEPWGGYGIDEVVQDADDAASGFISLSEITAE